MAATITILQGEGRSRATPLSCNFEVLRSRRRTVQKGLELVLSGWPSIRLRDVELRSGIAGWCNRLCGFVNDLSVLVGPTGLQSRRCGGAFGGDRRVDRIVWFE